MLTNKLIVAAGFAGLAVSTTQAQVTLEIFGAGFGANDISADGSVIVGNTTNDGLYQQARWTEATGFVLLGQATGPVFGTGAGAPQVSNDGTVISSTIASKDNSYITAGLWTEGQGWQEMFPPLLPEQILLDLSYGSSWALSGDGSTTAGLYWRDRLKFGGGSAHAFSWNATDGAVDLGGSSDALSSRVNGLNLDGSVAVGWEAVPFGYWQATVWVNGVKTRLVDVEAWVEARAVNDDGTVVVGWTIDEAINTSTACKWTWDGANWNEELLGLLPGTPIGPSGGRSFASAVSGDGSVIVGTNRFIDNGPFSLPTGFIWTESTGMIGVEDFLADHGISLPAGFQIDGLTGITQDGTKIIGIGSYPASYPDYWSILIDLGDTFDCLADVNGDGDVTPTDFTAWVSAFNNNLPECDQNGDGSCTPTDFSAWITNYNAGC
ncbi:MAG: GC-type dockerin domain-anchored protein [Phycisphaerales bacterium JB061]